MKLIFVNLVAHLIKSSKKKYINIKSQFNLLEVILSFIIAQPLQRSSQSLSLIDKILLLRKSIFLKRYAQR
jgi:hypothetical protein